MNRLEQGVKEQGAVDEQSESSATVSPPARERESMADPLVFVLLLFIFGSFLYVMFISVPAALTRGGELVREFSEAFTAPSAFEPAVSAPEVNDGMVDQEYDLSVQSPNVVQLPPYVYTYPRSGAGEPPTRSELFEMGSVADFTVGVELRNDFISLMWPTGVDLQAGYLVNRISGQVYHLFGADAGMTYADGYLYPTLPPFLPVGEYFVLVQINDSVSSYALSDMTKPIVITKHESGFLVFRGIDPHSMLRPGDGGMAVSVFINDPALSPHSSRALTVDLIPRPGTDTAGRTEILYESGYFNAPGSAYTEVIFPLNIPSDMPLGEYDVRATLRYRTEGSVRELAYSLVRALTVIPPR